MSETKAGNSTEDPQTENSHPQSVSPADLPHHGEEATLPLITSSLSLITLPNACSGGWSHACTSCDYMYSYIILASYIVLNSYSSVEHETGWH